MNNKAQAGMTGPLLAGVTAVILLFIVGFVISIGANLVEDIQDSDDATNNGTFQSGVYNVTSNSLSGFDAISGFQGTIGLVIAAIMVISILLILVGAFLFKRLG